MASEAVIPRDLNEVSIEVTTTAAKQAMPKEDQVDIDRDIMQAQQENIFEYYGKYLQLTRELTKEGTNMVR